MENKEKPKTFEDSIEIIDEEINKKKGEWTLSAIQWMDFQDIAQILRIHIFKKWCLWDQSRPLRPWLHALITHQIINVVRNIYGNYSRPCLKCAAAEDGNLCSLYMTQCSACPLYAHWLRTKKNAHDIKLPVALEFHINEVSERPEETMDIEKATESLHERMEKILKPVEFKVYKFLYIDGGSEDGIAKILGFKTTEKGRQAGYRQLKNIKNSIFQKAKQAVYGGEVDFKKI